MTSRSKVPAPFMLMIVLLIFIISVFFAVFSVEYLSKQNNDETFAVGSSEIATTSNTTTSKPEATTSRQTQTTSKSTTAKLTTTNKEITKKPSINKFYNENDVVIVAKVLYGECRGVASKTRKACVVWVICNRADTYGMSIQSVIKERNQFCYNANAPINQDLYELAKDVLERWNREKNGETNVGRVLPKNYLYFHGDGKNNYFRDNYKQPYNVWNYSLSSPYNS